LSLVPVALVTLVRVSPEVPLLSVLLSSSLLAVTAVALPLAQASAVLAVPLEVAPSDTSSMPVALVVPVPPLLAVAVVVARVALAPLVELADRLLAVVLAEPQRAPDRVATDQVLTPGQVLLLARCRAAAVAVA
jgi:hypothetical protein